MVIYLDLIFFMNFIYDFIILFLVSKILKRNYSIKRLLLSSFIGSLSIGILFLNINIILSLFIKILISILMMIIAYKYLSLKYTFNNLLYFYLLSFILEGIYYLLNISFKINLIITIILSPLILIIIYYHKKNNNAYNLYYDIKIYYKNKYINTLGYIDSGNNLTCPITKKGVIIVNEKIINKLNLSKVIYVPFYTINGYDLMKCYKIDYLLIDNHKLNNYLIGVSNIKLDEYCLLNNKIMEDICLKK